MDNSKNKQPISIGPKEKSTSSIEGISKFKPKREVTKVKPVPEKTVVQE